MGVFLARFPVHTNTSNSSVAVMRMKSPKPCCNHKCSIGTSSRSYIWIRVDQIHLFKVSPFWASENWGVKNHMAHGISLGWLGGVVHLGPDQQQLLRLGGSHGEPRKQQSKGGYQNRDTGQRPAAG